MRSEVRGSRARGLRSNGFWVFACFVSLSFAGLVVLARSLNPIPSRTRPLNSSAPMVLWLKPWESRSLPGLPRTKQFLLRVTIKQNAAFLRGGGVFVCVGPCITCRRRFHDRVFGGIAGAGIRSKTPERSGPLSPFAALAIVIGRKAAAR